MPGQNSDRRPPRRDSYADVGARSRQSLERALAGGATPAERSVLGAVFYWTTTFSRTGEPVSLGRIAQAAGMWPGRAEDCPRDVEKKVARRLRRLVELGAVIYRPGGEHGRGHASWLALPPVKEGSILNRGGSIDEREGGPAETPLLDVERGARRDPEGGPGRSYKGGQERPERGARRTPPPEDSPRTFRGEVRGARARRVNGNHVGSLAARLKACATTAAPDLEQEAERVSELVLDHLPADVADRALDELLESGEIPHPGAVLAALELSLDDDHAHALEELYADPRFRALHRGGTALAIADACPGPWTEHLEEAELVAEHFERHALPAGIVAQVLEDVARDGLKRPGHAARLARTAAAELGLELPPLELPPARRIARSRS